MWEATKERLSQYRMRGAMSGMGVAVGAGSIVFLTSLISSMAAEASQGLVRLGQNRIFVTTAAQKPGMAARPPLLTLSDALAVRKAVPDVAAATPMVALTATLNVCGVREIVRVVAAGPDHLLLENQRVNAGRYIAPVDVERRSNVVVVGNALWRRHRCLATLNAPVQIGGQSYRVIGLLGRKGARWGENHDESLHLPFSTAEHRYIRPGTPVSIVVSVRSNGDTQRVAAAVRRLLERRHPAAAASIEVSTQTDLLAEMKRATRRITGVTALILCVALVIAGIGIVNAVMTSVAERTAEIGLRRAVGATRKAIGYQFLFEAVVISVGGTVAGILAGTGGAAAASALLRMPPAVDVRVVFFAMMVSIILGLACGVWPALRAAALPPVEALRHE
jgi:putative ABC transport system permease protein